MLLHRILVTISKKSTGKSDYGLTGFPQDFALTPTLRTITPLKAKGNNSRVRSTIEYGFKSTLGSTF